MKAVAYQKPLPIADAQSLLDVNLPEPVPGERDLMVDVNAVSVNPVDTKMRMSSRRGACAAFQPCLLYTSDAADE